MKNSTKGLLGLTIGICVLSETAGAEGFDRALPNTEFLFQPGGYAEIGAGYLMPEITGVFPAPGGDVATGNIGRDFFTPQFAIKYDVNEKLSFGLQFSQPYGLLAQYPLGTPPGAPVPAQGTGGDFGADEVGISARYKFTRNHSAFGSVRVQRYSGYLNRGGVRFDFGSSTELGYSLGYAFEIPERRLLFTAEYTSAVKHTHVTKPRHDGLVAIADVESPVGVSFVPAVTGTPLENDTIHRTPQSLTLNFRSQLPIGDGKNLIFGRYRWADWSEADISFNGLNPTQFTDSQHFALGLGRVVTENLALTGMVEYRTGGASPKPGLTPFENSIGLVLGGRYILNDNVVLQAAYTYVKFDDATTTSGGVFTDNSAEGIAFKIGYYF
ncbi:OmpP1/FadL family transporter [Litoreibacter roseus]|uniref:Long-chain fatty acid transport protein n=1 Tax=Litoreibacter roseus TaxID=2601869 RepID=A0A6N6JJ74_9RHOB|nr:outer membrane protein transport protein [Litoreibacter roseus]GFE66184.1 hypothetical protein KIN_32580 [Litoreibacter roseus]